MEAEGPNDLYGFRQDNQFFISQAGLNQALLCS